MADEYGKALARQIHLICDSATEFTRGITAVQKVELLAGAFIAMELETESLNQRLLEVYSKNEKLEARLEALERGKSQ